MKPEDVAASQALTSAGCTCRHLEYDQYPAPHVYLIAQKPLG